MMIAHLPAGYLLTTALLRSKSVTAEHAKWLLPLGLLASILPDFDIAYFYAIDHRKHGHHSYMTHFPSFWIIVTLVGLQIAYIRRSRAIALGATFLGTNVLLHMALDTVVGRIAWLAPITPEQFYLFDVPRRFPVWYWNFAFHWSMLLEFAIVAAAVIVFWRRRKAAAVGLSRSG